MREGLGIWGQGAQDRGQPDRLGGVDEVPAEGRGLRVPMGEFTVELAFVRGEGTESTGSPDRTAHAVDGRSEPARPVLRAVPDLAPTRPELPHRRPSRRAIVRARVWGVPLPTMDDEIDPDSADQRIAEAVRLLGAL
jgi:hypothetical protein